MSVKPVYTFEEISNPERWNQLARDLEVQPRLCVLGDPVAHSKSPQMHNAALQHLNYPLQYIRVQVSPEEMPETLIHLRNLGFVGANVTIPHKFVALECVTSLDPSAKLMGAVNTIVFGKNGDSGFNTDGPGLANAVREEFGMSLADSSVLILGAGGGAGRAVAVQSVLDKSPRLWVVNRRVEKVIQLKEELQQSPETRESRTIIEAVSHEDARLKEILPEVDLIINATSLGMKSDDPLPIPADWLQPHHAVLDMVYVGAHQLTPLCREAIQRGGRAANGISMLLHQGALSFEHWFHTPAPIEIMRSGLVEATS